MRDIELGQRGEEAELAAELLQPVVRDVDLDLQRTGAVSLLAVCRCAIAGAEGTSDCSHRSPASPNSTSSLCETSRSCSASSTASAATGSEASRL